MARTDPQVNFRLPEELRDQLEESAQEARRSLSAEIIARLEASFGQELEDATLQDMAGKLSKISSLMVITEDGQTFRMQLKPGNAVVKRKAKQDFMQQKPSKGPIPLIFADDATLDLLSSPSRSTQRRRK